MAADLAVNPGSALPVTLLDTHAVFGTIAAGETASALSPIRFRIGSTLACTDQVLLDLINITADSGGPFADAPAYLAETLGEVPVAILAFEDFAAGLPVPWTVVDGGTGSGAASTWTDANPGSRTLGLTAPFMITDLQSDCSGIDLGAVAAVDIGVRQGSGMGTGTIWIDDITFDGAVPVELQSISIE